MSNILDDYEKRFKKAAPMPEQIEESMIIQVAGEHLEKGKVIPNDFDWWAAMPEGADA